MHKYLAIIFLCTFINAQADEYKGDTGFLSNQMAEWCVGESKYQNFCSAYLLGIYENSSWWAKTLRHLGLLATQFLQPVNKKVANQGLGIYGKLPDLARKS